LKVQLKDISKSFGPVTANDGVSVTIVPGTIHGLLGENGAGKSTLMKLLSGFISADRGQIILDEYVAEYHTPLQALGHGIGMLHQDPLDFPPLTVLDNFMLGAAGVIQPYAAARQTLLKVSRQFDFDLDPDAHVSALTPGERQQLEIVRLLARGAAVLILDEPTTGISQPQKVKLFAALRVLAAQGKTIIFVSHKLADVEELCGRVTVLRRGKVVGDLERPFDMQALVRLMFGQEIPRLERAALYQERVLFNINAVSVADQRLRLDGVSFKLHYGEVLGFAGLEGSGQRMLMRACGGLQRPLRGTIELNGQPLAGKPYRAFLEGGIAYLPAGRLEEGLIAGLDLTEHFELARRSSDFLIDWKRSQASASAKIQRFNIRGRPASMVEDLSGGNQQRALLALLPDSLRLLLLEHPTRGLDIESAQWVWLQLLARRADGAGIIFISADIDELLTYSDRVVVFSGGKVSAPFPAGAMTVESIGNLIGGKGI
jgi:general nucleoside transport system ATP-binding protein